MIIQVVATDAAAMQGDQVAMEAADNSDEVAGILDGITVGSGLLLDGIGTIGDSGSIRHFLLLGMRALIPRGKRVSQSVQRL